VILLEFNELSPKLIEGFMANGELPNFRRLRDRAQVFITDAQEAPPNLEPWVQWVTVHSGLNYDQHGVFHLGDGHRLDRKCLWDILSDEGYRVWVCGSMNQRYDKPINGALIPDPWATQGSPYPESLEPYYKFVRQNVQEYTNDRVPLSLRDYARFVTFMLRNGLSGRTSFAIVRQLVRERFNRRSKWRRATLLDKLQWDVFRSHYRRHRPHFSTFFINSTAHYQHAHWRNMDPEPFTIKPTDADQEEYRDAVLYGYREMDRIVGDALALADDGRTSLILASALGQQPCLKYEDIGGKTFYRPRVFERLLEWIEVPGRYSVAPVMSEEFHANFENEADARRAAEALRSLQVDGRPAMRIQEKGTNLYVGCSIFYQLDKNVELVHGSRGKSIPFFRLFYQVESLKSGMHHPDGILWILEPGVAPRREPERVPLLDLAPTVLDLFALEPPGDWKGRSLRKPVAQR